MVTGLWRIVSRWTVLTATLIRQPATFLRLEASLPCGWIREGLDSRTLTSPDLATAVILGDREASGRLFQLLSPAVLSIAWRILVSRSAAE